MKTQGVQPNFFSYNASIIAREREIQWEKGLELLSEMISQGVQPKVISYTSLRERTAMGESIGATTRNENPRFAAQHHFIFFFDQCECKTGIYIPVKYAK